MTGAQREWAAARDCLVRAVTGLGFSEELALLMARELKSPRAMDRMTSYIRQARPSSEEMLVDEMLAIVSEIEAWRAKKDSLRAQASYNEWLLRREEE